MVVFLCVPVKLQVCRESIHKSVMGETPQLFSAQNVFRFFGAICVNHKIKDETLHLSEWDDHESIMTFSFDPKNLIRSHL